MLVPYNFLFLGYKTYIFDDFVNFYDGQVYSVDIKKENVDYNHRVMIYIECITHEDC